MPAEVRYLDLADFLILAELATGLSAPTLARLERLSLAESALAAPAGSFGGVEFYPELELNAAVLCTHLVRNHPLPDGNKRTAYLCMVEFVQRNGRRWQITDGDPVDAATTVERVAAGELGEAELAEWIRARAR